MRVSNRKSNNPLQEVVDVFFLGPTAKLYVWWTCSYCHKDWKARVDARVRGGIMKGLASGMLPGFTLSYNTQVTLPGLKYKKPLWFDFHVTSPYLKRAIVIEPDGRQHFTVECCISKPHDHGKCFNDWIERVKRDLAKNKFCNSHSIHMLRISPQYKLHNYRRLIQNFIGDVLYHEETSDQPLFRVSCPKVYAKLREEPKN